MAMSFLGGGADDALADSMLGGGSVNNLMDLMQPRWVLIGAGTGHAGCMQGGGHASMGKHPGGQGNRQQMGEKGSCSLFTRFTLNMAWPKVSCWSL